MSEITKLYENAGIEKEVIKGCYDYYSKLGIDIWKENDCAGKNCDTCKKDKSIKRYPPFTAEKQIELIKWIAKTRPIHITFLIDKWVIEGMVRYGKRYDTFEDALSGYINSIWKDLSEEEKQQVKGIWEDNQ